MLCGLREYERKVAYNVRVSMVAGSREPLAVS